MTINYKSANRYLVLTPSNIKLLLYDFRMTFRMTFRITLRMTLKTWNFGRLSKKEGLQEVVLRGPQMASWRATWRAT